MLRRAWRVFGTRNSRADRQTQPCKPEAQGVFDSAFFPNSHIDSFSQFSCPPSRMDGVHAAHLLWSLLRPGGLRSHLSWVDSVSPCAGAERAVQNVSGTRSLACLHPAVTSICLASSRPVWSGPRRSSLPTAGSSGYPPSPAAQHTPHAALALAVPLRGCSPPSPCSAGFSRSHLRLLQIPPLPRAPLDCPI